MTGTVYPAPASCPPLPPHVEGGAIVGTCEIRDERGHVAWGVAVRVAPAAMHVVAALVALGNARTDVYALWWDRYATPPTWATSPIVY